MKAVSISEQYELTHPDDMKSGVKKIDRTIFVLAPLTVTQEEYLENEGSKITQQVNKDNPAQIEQEISLNTGTLDLMALHFCLKEIKNLAGGKEMKRDEKGAKLPGGVYQWTEESLGQIPKKVRSWLAQEIRFKALLEDDTAKN